jgi:L-cysteate sulfo-lyase
VDEAELAARVEALPRVRLGEFPTPLEPLPSLTRALGGPTLWVKRDDLAGGDLGGNKTRPLELLLGSARSAGARVVATFGGLQSNFARQMCSAAAPLGIEPHCFYFERRPARPEENLLLAQQAGGRLHFVPLPRREASMTVEQACGLVRWVVRLTPSLVGKAPYFMPVGGHGVVGCAGYVPAAIELERQLRERGAGRATVVAAAGTGGMLAGLLAGFRLLRSRHDVLGIDVGRLWRSFPQSIALLASQLCTELGEPSRMLAAQVPLIESIYVGGGYAVPFPPAVEASALVAAEEGLKLDPVYTAKAMAGLIDLIRQGRFGRDEHVVFVHSGEASRAPTEGFAGLSAPDDRSDASRGR